VLQFDLHLKEPKHVDALNIVYAKIGTKASVNALLAFIFANCVTLLTYALETMAITKAQLDNTSYVFNTIFVKKYILLYMTLYCSNK